MDDVQLAAIEANARRLMPMTGGPGTLVHAVAQGATQLVAEVRRLQQLDAERAS